MKQVSGKQIDISTLAKQLHTAITDALRDLEMNGFDTYFEQYNHHLFRKQDIVRLKKESRIINTHINGVNKKGQLVTGIHNVECFDFGEVEWLL